MLILLYRIRIEKYFVYVYVCMYVCKDLSWFIHFVDWFIYKYVCVYVCTY